jgi:hypothetical protein
MQFQPKRSQARAHPGRGLVDHSPCWKPGVRDRPHRGDVFNQAGGDLWVRTRQRPRATAARRRAPEVSRPGWVPSDQQQRNSEHSRIRFFYVWYRDGLSATDGGNVDGEFWIPQLGAGTAGPDDLSPATFDWKFLVGRVPLVAHAHAIELTHPTDAACNGINTGPGN